MLPLTRLHTNTGGCVPGEAFNAFDANVIQTCFDNYFRTTLFSHFVGDSSPNVVYYTQHICQWISPTKNMKCEK